MGFSASIASNRRSTRRPRLAGAAAGGSGGVGVLQQRRPVAVHRGVRVLPLVRLGRKLWDMLRSALPRRDGRAGDRMELHVRRDQRRRWKVPPCYMWRRRLRGRRGEGRGTVWEEGVAQFAFSAQGRRLEVQRGAREHIRSSHGLPRRQHRRALGRVGDAGPVRHRVPGRVDLGGGLPRRDGWRAVQAGRSHLRDTNSSCSSALQRL